MIKEFGEMRLNNDFLAKALKSSYKKISFLKKRVKELEISLKGSMVIKQDIEDLKMKKPKRKRL